MIAPREFALGQAITFEGYADDYGCRIVEMQFSLDGGKSWASFDASDASADLWVHWIYEIKPEERGFYQLKARSVSEDGRTSPLAAVADFIVV